MFVLHVPVESHHTTMRYNLIISNGCAIGTRYTDTTIIYRLREGDLLGFAEDIVLVERLRITHTVGGFGYHHVNIVVLTRDNRYHITSVEILSQVGGEVPGVRIGD